MRTTRRRWTNGQILQSRRSRIELSLSRRMDLSVLYLKVLYINRKICSFVFDVSKHGKCSTLFFSEAKYHNCLQISGLLVCYLLSLTWGWILECGLGTLDSWGELAPNGNFSNGLDLRERLGDSVHGLVPCGLCNINLWFLSPVKSLPLMLLTNWFFLIKLILQNGASKSTDVS